MVADVRVGGVERSYDWHFLCVGDAAGHVDPMTGRKEREGRRENRERERERERRERDGDREREREKRERGREESRRR
jgi:hypothetical protein